MPILLAVAGFLGAWLLVAGPMYQAALELEAEEIDRSAIQSAVTAEPRPKTPSPWWWLLPPVAFVKHQRRNRDYREAVVRRLSPELMRQWVHWNDKAVGWGLVGLGGLLLALKETWELVERLEWQGWAFWPMVVVAFLLCAAHTVTRMHRSNRVVGSAPEPAAQQGVQQG